MIWDLQAYIAGQEYRGPQQSAASAVYRAACQAPQAQSPRQSLETPFGREAHKSFACMVALPACCCNCQGVLSLEEGGGRKSSNIEVPQGLP